MPTYVIDVSKLVEIFCEADDFCKAFDLWFGRNALGRASKAGRKPSLSNSEVIAIVIFYHLSGMKNFQYYCQRLLPGLHSYFPGMVSYTQLLDRLAHVLPQLECYLGLKCALGAKGGHYYIDSKQLPVCHIRRTGSNKVFKGVASRGKSSTGWFFGLKMHLVINERGEPVRFLLTPGHVADNNEEALNALLNTLKGDCYGDKGYITKHFARFYESGLRLVTKPRSNMRNLPATLKDAFNLRKRGLIESVFDILSSVLDIDHTRHRKPANAIAHLFAGVIAYCFLDKKPSLKQHFIAI